MPPTLIIFALEEAIKESPAIYADVQALFKLDNPTPQDWTDLRARVRGKSYRDFVPGSALPPGEG